MAAATTAYVSDPEDVVTLVVNVELFPPPCSMWRTSARSRTVASSSGVVAVDGQHGEDADQEDALPQDVLDAVVQRLLVVGCEEQDASGDGVHDVPVGGLHDDVPGEGDGELPLLGEVLLELVQVLLVRKLPEQEEVGALLESEPFVQESGGQVLDVVPAVAELA